MNNQRKIFDSDTGQYITLAQMHERIQAQGEPPEDFDGEWERLWERIDPSLVEIGQRNEAIYFGRQTSENLRKLPAERESYYAYKPITYPIRLDFGACACLADVHRVLKEGFGLPEYYGENWDALWDCLDGYFADDAGRVEFCGLCEMDAELYRYCEPMFRIFERLSKQTLNVKFVYLS